MNAFDSTVSALVNQFAHHSVHLDYFIVYLSGNRLIKGGVMLGLVWWAWFRAADARRREAMLAALIAIVPARDPPGWRTPRWCARA